MLFTFLLLRSPLLSKGCTVFCKLTAARVDKENTFHLCKEAAFVGFVSLLWKESATGSSGFQMGSFHVSALLQVASGNLLKNRNTYRRGAEKMTALSSLHLLLQGITKNNVVFGFFGLSQASLQKFAQNSLIWNTEGPYVTSRCPAHPLLRFRGLHCLPTAGTGKRLFPNVIHSQTCKPGPKSIALCCSVAWCISKISVFYKLISPKRKIKVFIECCGLPSPCINDLLAVQKAAKFDLS